MNKRQENENEYILVQASKLTCYISEGVFSCSRVEPLSIDTELAKRFSKTLNELLEHFDLQLFPRTLAVSLTLSDDTTIVGTCVKSNGSSTIAQKP